MRKLKSKTSKRIPKAFNLVFLMVVLSVLFFPSASAIEKLGTFEKDQDVVLRQVCPTCSSVNITAVTYPNSTKIIGPVEMNQSGDEFTYVLDSNFTSVLGTYNVEGVLNPGGSVDEFAYTFDVTNAGKNFTTGEALGGIGAMAAALFASFMFSRVGFRLGDDPKMIPVSFLFVTVSLALTVYGLFLGYSFGQDIVQYSALSSLAETIFFAVIWILAGIAVIFMAIMLISFIKQLSYVVEKRKFGEDWNPLTKSYEA